MAMFPMPGVGKDQSVRMFVFSDVGNVFPTTFDFNDLRASVGVGLNWISPLGPLKLSLGYPVRKKPEV